MRNLKNLSVAAKKPERWVARANLRLVAMPVF
jgi:hypothetical protein